MNINIESYMNDGANWQAQCVLACLRSQICRVTDLAWNEKRNKSDAEIKVGRYENCREQGYVFSLLYDYKQVVHVAVYEHRNSDELIVIAFKASVINTPTIDVVMKDRTKFEYTKSFECGHIEECVEYIVNEMRRELLFSIENKKQINELSKLN